MKKLSIVFISLFSFFFCFISVYANNINSIDMDIYIDENGNANITEIWKGYLDRGTEGYKSFSNMENAYISDFKVSDDTGTIYQYQNNWDVNLNFEEKKYKNGIYKTYSGVDLCWGISNYGERTYNLNYKINNFVNKYSDSQGIYFKLLKLDQSVDIVNIKVRSYIPINIDNSKIWGFGYTGEVNFIDNEIVMNVGYLPSYKYVTLMVRFESDLYNTNSFVNKSFNNIYEEAFGLNKKNNDFYIKDDNDSVILAIIYLISIFLICVIPTYLSLRNKGNTYKTKYIGKRNIRVNEVDYYREIPCNKDIMLIYYLLQIYSTIDNEKLKKRLINAYILKWILEDKVEYIDGELHFKYDYKERLLNKELRYNSTLEDDLFRMFVSSTNGNKILEKNEFKKYCKKNFSTLKSWFNSVSDSGRSYYFANKYITTEQKIINNILRKENRWITVYNEILRDEAVKVIGLNKFLLDFGRMFEKSSIEVELWNYYLICAELFGIADKVRKEMKDLIPEMDFKVHEIDLDYVSDIIDSGYKSMISAERAYNRRVAMASSSSSDYDYSGSDSYSGGGGSSFDSGGSSSGGSSGGGFR